MSYVGKWFGFGRDDHYDRGLRAYDRGMYEQAVEEFERCVQSTRDPATLRLGRFYLGESYAQLGMAALRSERFAAAVEQLEKAVDLHPSFPDLRYRLACALRRLGDRRRAREHVAVALAINPKYALAILLDGLLQYENGDAEGALARIEEAAQVEPSLAGDQYQFAIEAHATGDWERALANFQAIAPADADDANAHARLASAFVKHDQLEAAAREYRRALEIAPGYADMRYRYGEVLLALDQVDHAAREFRSALDINPKYADAHAALGIALRRLGDEDGARASFHSALEHDPHHVIATEELSRRR